MAEAGQRCEYCLVHQDDFDFFTFHVEHIIPRQHGGNDDSENLCLVLIAWAGRWLAFLFGPWRCRGRQD
ncbi:MAG: HNH endonuclease [Gemmataceae bacterium]